MFHVNVTMLSITHVTGGVVLGGSSSHNGMIYVRGCKEDYDNWESLGAKGWSFNDVLPYFMKSEDNRIPENNNSGNTISVVHVYVNYT
ncbi:hypothetical protein KUTeg_002528 [Tegillarca granosa]|uniref:Glucose-methanol-choline oxidoreductase N-terminal domain-containing protein n=1 Tax=Tegillarca granosa TaxID=220873 RepID=A0ABQ9FW22_TEGGR|nr:hypothetical protein KUTeg_002528 [Tegillarca granosa]